MAVKTDVQIGTAIDGIADGGANTAADMRGVLDDINDSKANSDVFDSDLTLTGGFSVPDDVTGAWGNNDELTIQANATAATITETASGNFVLRGENIQLRSEDGSEVYAVFNKDDLAGLYYDNTVKLVTKSYGARIDGGAALQESASAPSSAISGYGQLWVKDDSPNVPMFTDDAGTDFQLAVTTDVCATRDTVAILIADTALTYTSGMSGTVSAGDVVVAGPYYYTVAASGASDHHTATAGGVKLYVQMQNGGYNIRAFGVTGAGDDTATVQAALNLSTSLDGSLIVDGVFEVTNLKLPHNTAYDSAQPFWAGATALIGKPGAAFERIAGGDTTYMIASTRWVDNVAFPQSPVYVEGVKFDGKGICDDVFVNVGYASVFRDCIFDNALQDGLSEPTQTADATALGSSRYGCRYERNKFRYCARYGFSVGAVNGSAIVTDCWFVDNEAYDNGWNIAFSQCTGWKIKGNHAWNAGTAPDAGAGWSVFMAKGKSGMSSGNLWEGYASQTVGLLVEVDGDPINLIGDKFLLGLGLQATFTAASTLVVQGCTFGTGTQIRHWTSTAGRDIMSIGNLFLEASPYAFSGGGSHAGRVISQSDRIVGSNRILTGHQKNGSLASQVLPGTEYWSSDAAFACDDTTPEVVRLSASLSSARAFTLDQSPHRGMRRTLTRGSGVTGSVANVTPYGGSTLIGVTAGTSVTVEHDGTNWYVVSSASA